MRDYVAIGVIALLAGCSGQSTDRNAPGKTGQSNGQLTVMSWGGNYQQAQRANYFQPFAAAANVTVSEREYDGDLRKAGAVDVVDVDSARAIYGCRDGSLQKLDVGRIGAKEKFYPSAVHACAIGTASYATLIVYDPKAFASDPPTKLADLFDLQRYPGKRSLLKGPFGNLEWALIADGVPTAEVYRELATSTGVDRAFRKLDTIKPEIVWWDYGKGSSQPYQFLSESRVVMASAWSGGIKNPLNSGAFGTIWDYQAIDWNYWAIPQSANSDLAYEFLKLASGPAPMARVAEAVRYGPSNMDAVPMIAKAALDDLPDDPAHMATAFPLDPEFWASHHDALSKRFAAWLVERTPAKQTIDTTDVVEPELVRADILPNWNIDYEAAEACPKPFQLYVGLKPGGVVQDVTLKGLPSDDTACRSLVEFARRAVLQSSPLPVPNDVTRLTINFDIPAVLEQL